MHALRSEPATRRAVPPLAAEAESPWEALGFADLVPPASLAEAQARRDELAGLLRRERAAAADFLLALADFDRRRGWERLGHASLFAFLTRELGLSNGAAYLRSSAARLLPRFPAVDAALRDGRLCLSAVGELARVLTPDNEAAVLPRYLGCSAREAREVTAALRPEADPPRRTVMTIVAPPRREAPPEVRAEPPGAVASLVAVAPTAGVEPSAGPNAHAATATRPSEGSDAEPLRAHEVAPTHPARATCAVVEPLTADLRRLHLTVSAGFLAKLAAARTGLSHAMPGASVEQALEAALDLLLERQGERRAKVRRPRAAREVMDAGPPGGARDPGSNGEPSAADGVAAAPPPRARRPHVAAAVEREVRRRDGDRCQWPLDAGGVCGATWQVELDHVVPLALGGASHAANLRCLCKAHNQRAATLALGEGMVVGARRRPGR